MENGLVFSKRNLRWNLTKISSRRYALKDEGLLIGIPNRRLLLFYQDVTENPHHHWIDHNEKFLYSKFQISELHYVKL